MSLPMSGEDLLADSTPPSNSIDPGASRRTWRRVAVIGLALNVILVGAFAYAWIVGHPPLGIYVPPHLVEVLGSGRIRLTLPYMTLYTAPDPGTSGFNVDTDIRFASHSTGPNTSVVWRWGPVVGTDLPVRFVLTYIPSGGYSPEFQAGPANAFVHLPAGNCSAPCSEQAKGWNTAIVDRREVFLVNVNLTYDVVRMAETRDSVETMWLQVNYSLLPRLEEARDLPTTNVSEPSPFDLVPVGGPILVQRSIGPWNFTRSVDDFPMPSMPFTNTLSGIPFDAGELGTLGAPLTSEFRWNSAGKYEMRLGGTGDVDVTMQFYVDRRFGGLTVAYLA